MEPNPLSGRQLQIVQMLADDKPQKVIAHECEITLNIISRYMTEAKRATGQTTSHGVVAKAIRNGWIK